MRKLLGLAVVGGLGLLTPALAGTPKIDAAGAASQLVTKADEMGYDVHSVRERHGRYHADLLDRATGGAVHAEFRATDGELVSARLAHDKDGDMRKHDDDDRPQRAGERHDRRDDRD